MIFLKNFNILVFLSSQECKTTTSQSRRIPVRALSLLPNSIKHLFLDIFLNLNMMSYLILIILHPREQQFFGRKSS